MDEFVPQHVLVTGGAGFIGGNLVRWLLGQHRDLRVTNLDALTYAGCMESLADVDRQYGPAGEGRYRFVKGDICDRALVSRLVGADVDAVLHLAAESHVDRSILGPEAFIKTNVHGTFVLLEAVRAAWGTDAHKRFLSVSTDEVYGSIDTGPAATEDSPYRPNSPYAASKAAADHLVRAYHRTYGVPAIITNCCNNYGPFQFPEKLIPFMILNGLEGKPLGVYGDGRNVRDWIFVEDHCRALDVVLRRGRVGQSYNVGDNNQWHNIDLVNVLCDLLDELKPRPGGGSYRTLVEFVADRPGHDRRYALDASKAQGELGWRPVRDFRQGLRETVAWYLAHGDWLALARGRRVDIDYGRSGAGA